MTVNEKNKNNKMMETHQGANVVPFVVRIERERRTFEQRKSRALRSVDN